jgi:3-hydroxymyristoyl/3-hydroxydecanoyl-(acyl carrier protein) dehydratase
MMDKVTELTKKKIVITKKLLGNEDFFKGHFVGFPIMPGALIVESMGQAGTLLLRYNIENHQEKEILAYNFKKAKFLYPTLPGDELTITVAMKWKTKKGATMKGTALIGDRLVTQASFTLAIVDKARFRAKFARN